jgi:hypothetical protein
MKKLLTVLLSLSLLILQGQVMDRTVEDCNNNSNSIFNILASGKALIIASKGFDCSICVNRAPGWGTWATANKQQVEVWGAMTNTYSSAIPSCNMGRYIYIYRQQRVLFCDWYASLFSLFSCG